MNKKCKRKTAVDLSMMSIITKEGLRNNQRWLEALQNSLKNSYFYQKRAGFANKYMCTCRTGGKYFENLLEVSSL